MENRRPNRSKEPEEYLDWRTEMTVPALDYITATVQDIRFRMDNGGDFKDDLKTLQALGGLSNLLGEMCHFFKHEVEFVAKQAVEAHAERQKYAAIAEDLGPQLAIEVEQFLQTEAAGDRPDI